jgi:hypothetical protein
MHHEHLLIADATFLAARSFVAWPAVHWRRFRALLWRCT